MKTTVVNKSYPGLRLVDDYYALDCDLIVDGDLVIQLDKRLIVKGEITAGGSVTAGWSVTAERGSVTAGFSIKASTSIKCDIKVFAGICSWRQTTVEERQIVAQTLDAKYGIGCGKFVQLKKVGTEKER